MQENSQTEATPHFHQLFQISSLGEKITCLPSRIHVTCLLFRLSSTVDHCGRQTNPLLRFLHEVELARSVLGTGVKWRIKRIDLDLNLCLRPAFPPNYLASMANGHIGHFSKATYGRKSILHNLAMHSLTLTGLRQVVIKPKESDNC